MDHALAPPLPLVTRRRSRIVADAPLRRTLGLAGALVVAAGLLAWVAAARPGITHHGAVLPWWAVALAFLGAELCSFRIEVRREATTFTLSEMPLIIGLIYASPSGLVAGRLVGEALVLLLVARQTNRKLVLNLSSFLAECAAALAVVRLVGWSPLDLQAPATWLVLLLAVIAADLCSIGTVTTAMRFHGAPTHPLRLMQVNAVTAVGNTTLALTAALLLSVRPAAALLVAVLIAVLLFAYRSYAALGRRFNDLEQLYDVTRLVSGSRSPDEVITAILQQAMDLSGARLAGAVLLGDTAHVAGQRWITEDGSPTDLRLDPSTARTLARGRGTVRITIDTPADSRAVADQLGVSDCVIAPLRTAGRSIGLLVIAERAGDISTFDAEDAELCQTLAGHAAVALENGRLIGRLQEEARRRRHEALHDPLTGLPNRADFEATLAELFERPPVERRPFGVGVIDLDGFKRINDTYGHVSGDLLLQRVSRRLERAVPEEVAVSRLGGDEFALVLTGEVDDASLTRVGEAVTRALSVPVELDGPIMQVGASIGFARCPDHAADPRELIRRADVAMYRAKADPRGSSVQVWDPEAGSPGDQPTVS